MLDPFPKKLLAVTLPCNQASCPYRSSAAVKLPAILIFEGSLELFKVPEEILLALIVVISEPIPTNLNPVIIPEAVIDP